MTTSPLEYFMSGDDSLSYQEPTYQDYRNQLIKYKHILPRNRKTFQKKYPELHKQLYDYWEGYAPEYTKNYDMDRVIDGYVNDINYKFSSTPPDYRKLLQDIKDNGRTSLSEPLFVKRFPAFHKEQILQKFWVDCPDIHCIQNSWGIMVDGYIRNDKSNFDWLNGIDGIDYLVCPICSKKRRDLGVHIIEHGLVWDEAYPNMPSKCMTMRDGMRGDQNPAYQHNGLYSPFSKNFIKGYDEEWHKNHLDDLRETMLENKDTNPVFIDYWLIVHNGNEELAQEAYTKFQIRDLDHFINKWGEGEGIIRHQNKTDKWVDSFYSKSEEEMADIVRRRVTNGRTGAVSRIETELFNALTPTFPSLQQQLTIKKIEGKGWFIYDFHINKKIIEFNGDYWHLNPDKYEPDFINTVTKRTAQETWEFDKNKLSLPLSLGYEVLVIWELYFRQDKQREINKCIDFLNQSTENLLM